MSIRYSKGYLTKIEDIIAETDYILRYEKGAFKSGYCILNEKKIIIVNKYFPLEGRINSLIDILKIIDVNAKQLSDTSRKLFFELAQTEIQL